MGQGGVMGTDMDEGLVIIWHSRTGGAAAMARAAMQGAAKYAPDIPARLIPADAANAKHVIGARACLFVCPENLASMTGVMKEFFDRSYYPVLAAGERIAGRPYATAIAAGSDERGRRGKSTGS
ncbi:hypothetical protein GCM10010990_14780 [Croceicoccus mobilis]|uniref:NADPH-dependent FMN reductase-like domain-containing protein n=2 Tax=Croceicoccus mobilis TaxID=1703339 RepID=A0A916YXZ7_9SPHN|nr:hypothetical protein GCM10010990_14780 [Croceicoccus mobilis]